jgi:FKBP-type peptidyl-prolyl cis-trans isomerase
MNKNTCKILITISTLIFATQAANSAPLESDKEKISYAIGQQIGTQIKSQGVDIDIATFTRSIEGAVQGKPSELNAEEIQAAMLKLRDNAMAKMKKEADENAVKGKKFLDENKAKPGVKVTASGLQYKVVKEGTGPQPKASDKVKVHYKGTLLDGTEFDSSYKRNQPAEFPLQGVIKGWTEGIPLMKTGSTYTFYIPAELAYGPQGRPGIPGNSVLTFDVELLEILK